MTDSRKFYYRKIASGSWLKSDHPHKTGIWLTEKAYNTQMEIQKMKDAQTAKSTRGKMRRKLGGES